MNLRPAVLNAIHRSNAVGRVLLQDGRMSFRTKRRKRKAPKRENIGRPLVRSYSPRKAALKELGFASYPAYLRSELWQSIRADILADNPDCIRCRGPANCVHHSNYNVAVLNGTDRRHLYSICDDCHKLAEFDQHGKKTTIGRANRFLGITDRRGRWRNRPNKFIRARRQP
jgi:hypothetical protein